MLVWQLYEYIKVDMDKKLWSVCMIFPPPPHSSLLFMKEQQLYTSQELLSEHQTNEQH